MLALTTTEFVFWPFLACYIAINFVSVYLVHQWLKTRIANRLLAWLFSVSLSLGLTFLIVLLIISIWLKSLN